MIQHVIFDKVGIGRQGVPKVQMVIRGGHSNVHISPQGGRGGGQKRPKIGPHGLRMPPYMDYIFSSSFVFTYINTCQVP